MLRIFFYWGASWDKTKVLIYFKISQWKFISVEIAQALDFSLGLGLSLVCETRGKSYNWEFIYLTNFISHLSINISLYCSFLPIISTSVLTATLHLQIVTFCLIIVTLSENDHFLIFATLYLPIDPSQKPTFLSYCCYVWQAMAMQCYISQFATFCYNSDIISQYWNFFPSCNIF